MPFDPDAFLSGNSQKDISSTFDPDAFLSGEKQKKPVIKPDLGIGEKILGGAETALSVLSGVPAGLGGGLGFIGGTAASGGDIEAGLAAKKGIEEGLTFQPRTEAGKQGIQAVGEALAPVGEAIEGLRKPLGEAEFASTEGKGVSESQRAGRAAIASIAPDILIEATALFSGGLTRIAKSKAGRLKKQGEALKVEADEILNPDEAVDFESASKIIKSAKPEDIAKLVNSDPSVLGALEELGLGDQALASYSSQNPQFRAIEQGLASLDASDLSIQQKQFMVDLSQKADNLILEGGGTLDKASLSETIKTDMLDTIDGMYEIESEVYDNMRAKLPQNTKTDPKNVVALIEGWASEVGGVSNLDPVMRRLHKSLKPTPKTSKGVIIDPSGKRATVTTEDGLPTFGLLNSERRLIGQQLGRKSNTKFRNSELGQLKALYSAMKRDQKEVIDSTGDDSLITLQDSADKLTFQRKRLESDTQDLFGSELNKELMTLVGASVKGLEKGNLQKFKGVIDKIPERHRSSAVITAMNDVFKGTAASKQQLGDAQFARFWTSLNRSPTVKAELFKQLPSGSRKAINNLGEVVTAVNRANQDKITTGRLSEFFNDRSGVLGNLANNLVTPVGSFVVAKSGGGPVGAMAFSKLMENSTDQAKASNKMLADGQFKKLLKDSVRGGVADGIEIADKVKAAEQKFMKSKVYEKWADNLGSESAQAAGLVSRVGIMNYLLNPQIEREE